MKKVLFFFGLSIFFLLHSCSEVLPKRVIQNVILDTNYMASNPNSIVPQQRRVLFEEYTGASCVNCPDGHAKLKEITDLYGSNMSVMGLHFGSLSAPVRSGEQDLRTTEATELAATFGVSSMPSATIDRKSFGGNTVVGRLEWKADFESIMNAPVVANVSTKAYTYTLTNTVVLEMTIEFLQDYTGDANYSIALLENNIAVTQKNGSAEIEDYDQEHVLRKMYTNSLGNSLTKPSGSTKYEKGRTYKKIIQLTDLAAKWKLNDLYLIAFLSDANSKEILQASEVKYQP